MLAIRSLEVAPWDLELIEPFGIATGAQRVANNALLRLELDDGSVGYGEAAPFPAVNGETQVHAISALKQLMPAVVGQSALRWQNVSDSLSDCPSPSARCALESALLDALCRSKRLPLWAWFGGRELALSTDITIVTGGVERARNAAARAARAGFRVLKVKLGAGSIDQDVERLIAVAEAAPRARFVLDANTGHDADDSIRLCRELGELRQRVALLEQPAAADDLEGLCRVRRETGLAVAADESARTPDDVTRIVRASAADVINIKITKSGVGPALTMIAHARAAGLKLMIGGMVESKLCMSVSACLAGGSGGFSFVDLDTPLFIRQGATLGGYADSGPAIDLSAIEIGHGVTPVTLGG